MGIVNFHFKDGVTCSIFQHNIMRNIKNLERDDTGTTYGSKRIGISPITGKEVVQEFIGINNGEEQWESLHNLIVEDDVLDVAAFKKRRNL